MSEDLQHGTGWKVQSLDWRDHKINAPPKPIDQSIDIDLRQFPAMQFGMYDQGATNACVACAVARNVRYLMRAQGVPDFKPSPSFIYWAARKVANDVNRDDGCDIRQAYKQLNKIGVPPDEDWPLRVEPIKKNPPAKVIKRAGDHIILTYHSVPQKLNNILSCLTHRLPVVYGASVFDFWDSKEAEDTGIIPMPAAGAKPKSGHSTILIGWIAEQKRFIFANSWGDYWGMNGYGTIPADYVLNPDLAADFWSGFLMSKTQQEKDRK